MRFATMVAVLAPGAVGWLLARLVLEPTCIRVADWLGEVLR